MLLFIWLLYIIIIYYLDISCNLYIYMIGIFWFYGFIILLPHDNKMVSCRLRIDLADKMLPDINVLK